MGQNWALDSWNDDGSNCATLSPVKVWKLTQALTMGGYENVINFLLVS